MHPTLKYLFFIDSLGSGGAQRQMVNLALGLSRRNFEVEFLVYYPTFRHFAPDLAAANIKVHHVTKHSRFSIDVLRALRQRIREGKYSLVLSFLDTPNLYAELAMIGMQDLPLIVSERNSYPDGIVPLGKRIIEQFHRLASHITVNSHYQAQLMANANPWLRDRISVIYNGIDLERFRISQTSMTHKRTLLSVGSVIVRKNGFGLAKALVEYKSLFGDPPTIAWVGAVPDTDEGIYESGRIRELLKQHHLEHRWQWHGERSDVHTLYGQYPALVHPSFQEGLANVICEAMACGTPVLASNVGEHLRLVEHGRTGFRFSPDSPREIAQTMHQFLTLSQQKQFEMGQMSRSFAENEFAFDTFLDRYERVFASVVRR